MASLSGRQRPELVRPPAIRFGNRSVLFFLFSQLMHVCEQLGILSDEVNPFSHVT